MEEGDPRWARQTGQDLGPEASRTERRRRSAGRQDFTPGWGQPEGKAHEQLRWGRAESEGRGVSP